MSGVVSVCLSIAAAAAVAAFVWGYVQGRRDERERWLRRGIYAKDW